MSLGEKTAVILLNFGGPTSLSEVQPFLKRIFSDRNVVPGFLGRIAVWFFSRAIAKVSVQRYSRIGGASPLVEITLRQAAALREELKRRGTTMPVYAGMRYCAPEIKDAVLDALSQGADDFIAVPLYPHYSLTSTGSAFAEFARCIQKVTPLAQVDYVDSYESHPGYIEALAGKLRGALREAEKNDEKAQVMFSAHSLPMKLLKKDTRYVGQVKTTAGLVAEAAGIEEYELAYQSARPGPGWLGPPVEETLGRLARGGCKSIVVIPLSFTCDNIETLYDIDIKLKEEADKLSVTLRRTESLNDSPAFISALADIVLEIQ